MEYRLKGSRIYFRSVTYADRDVYAIVKWRNTDIARKSYFSNIVSTPSGHYKFMSSKDENDFVFMVVDTTTGSLIGMTALKVDVNNFHGEYGRTFVDEKYRGVGFAEEIEYTLLSFAFDYLNLKSLWLDAFVDNVAIIQLHKKTGWDSIGTDVEGHTNKKGIVLHMQYSKETWMYKKKSFIDKYKIILED
jgi:RimJ/RimL family protein N-acetyltransferase